jgi:hypothetical protein
MADAFSQSKKGLWQVLHFMYRKSVIVINILYRTNELPHYPKEVFTEFVNLIFFAG